MNAMTGTDALSRYLFKAGAALPFLRASIEQLKRVPDDTVWHLATDGLRVFYDPDGMIDGPGVNHMLMHCLFRHPVPPEGIIKPLWNLACDISAEYLRGDFFSSAADNQIRREIAEALPEGVDPRASGAVYRCLMDLFEDELEPLYARFRRDDHRYWYAPPLHAMDEGFAFPKNAGESIDTEKTGVGTDATAYTQWVAEALDQLWPSPEGLPGGTVKTGRFGLSPGSREEKMLLREAAKYDFSRYLRRFSTTREELRLDLDSFDYIPYYYGFQRYGNLPMIEPLEYSEHFRVEALVIAIDTSGSCTRSMVQRFLAEIEGMLLHHDSFFSRMEVHIIQCDAIVQSHVVIHSVEEWQRYAKDIAIKGRGGTNFQPVFDLVEKLRKGGRLKRLKGLLYFTDGDGVYPRKPTPYETAFVFTSHRALGYSLPKWIVPLCLEPTM